ncbi:MAG: ATP-binding protein [Clostridiales Family XIII bacterium]|jgi:predicted AAA+ superfamily ATPase|nr:ATP-binding protein [Clostridiales Family XIII bacterium]
MIKREIYLSKIRGFYDSDLIKVITGIRRSGKSVLMSQIIDELKNHGVDDSHIVYINFEDFDYSGYTDPKAFHQFVMDKIKDKRKYYLLFDEIQAVDSFEKAINSFRVKINSSIFITGSNSKLMAGEFATLLSGRYVSIHVLPFVFKEFLELNQMDAASETDKSFEEFLRFGGMPQIYNTNNERERRLYLKDLYNTIVLKDIVERNKIKNPNLLNRIVQFSMENIGQIVSANSIAKYFKSERIETTVDTVLNYLDKITSALIFSKVNRYDIRGKHVMATLDKYYISDLGFLQLKNSQIELKIGSRLENIVYNELLSRDFLVYIGKTNNGEIDFVADDGEKRIYIQVTDLLGNDEVISREFGAFNSINDNYEKIVLSMDKLDYSRNGIKHINIVDWLLER